MCALVLGFLDAILILLYLVHQIRFDGDLILFHRVNGVSSIPFFDYSVRRISLSDKFEARNVECIVLVSTRSYKFA
jgi:hypothetical protein